MPQTKKKKDWIQGVEKEMEKDKTEGKFSDKAKRNKMTTHAYALEVIKKYKGKPNLTDPQEKLLKQAVLSETFRKMRLKRKK